MVLNFWATWCTPCVEEMPLLNAFFLENKSKSWQMIGLAIDQPSAVKRFLGQHPVEYAIGLAGLDGTELMKNLGNARRWFALHLGVECARRGADAEVGQAHRK